MNSIWQSKIDELQAYIYANPEIIIKRDSVCIPENLRVKFYLLFDDARRTIVQTEMGELWTELKYLISTTMQIEQTLCMKSELFPQLKEADNKIRRILSSPAEKFFANLDLVVLNSMR
jgi:hypothetical protein